MTKVISELKCEHGVNQRIVVDESLMMRNKENVFVLGDCALIKDQSTNRFYPSTAQHTIREGKVVAKNLSLLFNNKKELTKFSFHSLGIMAIIGNRVGIDCLTLIQLIQKNHSIFSYIFFVILLILSCCIFWFFFVENLFW